mmetsp:Transcript_4722/g.7626  ORF Transcript_4722/g.7626 Transcript_4722/m.7626 type:complete len:116 (-) Transcript_4722:67-414(-)
MTPVPSSSIGDVAVGLEAVAVRLAEGKPSGGAGASRLLLGTCGGETGGGDRRVGAGELGSGGRRTSHFGFESRRASERASDTCVCGRAGCFGTGDNHQRHRQQTADSRQQTAASR